MSDGYTAENDKAWPYGWRPATWTVVGVKGDAPCVFRTEDGDFHVGPLSDWFTGGPGRFDSGPEVTHWMLLRPVPEDGEGS